MPELNSRKKRWRPALDPFDVQSGWFRIELPSLILAPTDAIPSELAKLVRSTLEVLDLADGLKLMRIRRRWMSQYLEGKVQLPKLDDDFPLLADAIRGLFCNARRRAAGRPA